MNISDVVAANVIADAKRVATFCEADIVDYLVTGDATTLREREVFSTVRREGATYILQRIRRDTGEGRRVIVVLKWSAVVVAGKHQLIGQIRREGVRFVDLAFPCRLGA